jgi:DNA-binding response OmpR family regulator
MENLQTEQALLIWKEGDLIRDQWILSEPEITIGRAADCRISIPVRWISRQHARLRREGEHFLVEDVGSKNGLFVNGQRVLKPQSLNDGDLIQLAPGLELVYVDRESTAPLPGRESRLGLLRVDEVERKVYIHGQPLTPPLSTQQFQLLAMLANHPGKVHRRAEVIAAAWPDDSSIGVSDDAIDALIRRLRQRLADAAPEHNFIVTVRGYGFKLDTGAD